MPEEWDGLVPLLWVAAAGMSLMIFAPLVATTVVAKVLVRKLRPRNKP